MEFSLEKNLEKKNFNNLTLMDRPMFGNLTADALSARFSKYFFFKSFNFLFYVLFTNEFFF
jgi:hypothetical protein